MSNDRAVEKMTRQIIELLKQERTAITKGQYEKLHNINESKADIIVKLEEYERRMETMPARTVRNTELETAISIMKRRSEENQKLLMAARKGIKTAQNQINKIENNVDGFGAYDARGKQITGQTAKQKREQFI